MSICRIRDPAEMHMTERPHPCVAVRFGAFEALTAIAQQNGYDRSSSVDTVCGFWAGEKQSECLRTVIQVVSGPRV